MSFDSLYPDVEKEVVPIIKNLAHSFAPSLGMGVDDAIQEGRIAFMLAMREYNYTRSRGGVKSFASTVVRNSFVGLLYKATTQARMPHTLWVDEFGETKIFKHSLASLDDISLNNEASTSFNPENAVSRKQTDNRVMKLRMRLLSDLTERDRAVFKCKSQPDEQFLVWLRNLDFDYARDELTNDYICRYLGLSKNSVDHSLKKIRRRFTRLAETEFIDLVAERIEKGHWPMFHISAEKDDHDYVRTILIQRKLEPRPTKKREIDSSGECGRVVESYHWGCVLFLKYNGNYRTVVAEGRFNKTTGELFGPEGTNKVITESVSWYGLLVQELKR